MMTTILSFEIFQFVKIKIYCIRVKENMQLLDQKKINNNNILTYIPLLQKSRVILMQICGEHGGQQHV